MASPERTMLQKPSSFHNGVPSPPVKVHLKDQAEYIMPERDDYILVGMNSAHFKLLLKYMRLWKDYIKKKKLKRHREEYFV